MRALSSAWLFVTIAVWTCIAHAQAIRVAGEAPTSLNAVEPTTPRHEYYVVPELGMEFGRLSSAVFRQSAAAFRNFPYSTAVAALQVGVRRDFVNVGIRYQGSYLPAGKMSDTELQKVYGDIGLDWHGEAWNVNAFVDIGWAALISRFVFLNGIGFKGGISFDLYITRWFSLGPVVSVDVQGFRDPDSGVWANAVGGTVLARVGFHL
jgi:hypothetical protein